MGSISTGIPGMEGLDAALQGIASLSTTATAQSLQTQYDSLRETFDDLKEGKIQQDAADAVRQLRDAQNSIVMVPRIPWTAPWPPWTGRSRSWSCATSWGRSPP